MRTSNPQFKVRHSRCGRHVCVALTLYKSGPFTYLVKLLLKGERIMDGRFPYDLHAVNRFGDLFAEQFCLPSKNNGNGMLFDSAATVPRYCTPESLWIKPNARSTSNVPLAIWSMHLSMFTYDSMYAFLGSATFIKLTALGVPAQITSNPCAFNAFPMYSARPVCTGTSGHPRSSKAFITIDTRTSPCVLFFCSLIGDRNKKYAEAAWIELQVT